MAEKKAKNNELDFDQSPQQDPQEAMRLYMQQYNMNEVKIAGDVRSVYVGEPKAKMKKETVNGELVKTPVLNEDGSPQYYDPFYSATVAFNGGEMNINIDKTMYEKITIGKRYLFEGVKGLNFGTVQDRFHSVTEL